jgi:hypothetical protein
MRPANVLVGPLKALLLLLREALDEHCGRPTKDSPALQSHNAVLRIVDAAIEA